MPPSIASVHPRRGQSAALAAQCTPAVLAEVFASLLAILASVLVSAMPTPTGKPVHWRTVLLMPACPRRCCAGVRESAQSWRELLLDLKRRGLAVAPELAIADGALGFWKAIEEVWPRTRSQRCWVHKTANVLNKLPKSQHSKAKRALQEIWMAETRNHADSAFDAFIETYAVKYDKAAACLVKDRETMLAFSPCRKAMLAWEWRRS